MQIGEPVFIWCDGGPAVGRTAVYPPPPELAADGGTYVLVDDGGPSTWRYEFVPATMRR